MAENFQTTQAAEKTEEVKPQEAVAATSSADGQARPRITGRGKVEAFTLDTPADTPAASQTPDATVIVADNTPNTIPAISSQQGASPQDALNFSDDQVMAALRARGMNVASLDDLKNGFSQQQQQPNNTSASTQETPEQKAEKERASEKRRLDRFLLNGWTIDDFVLTKTVATADLQQLSEADLRSDLKAKGFTDQQASDIIRERYYQLSDEDIDNLDDPDEKKIALQKRELGAERLKNYSAARQEQAKRILSMTDKQLEEQDLLERQEAEYSAKVAEYLKTVPRKQVIPLGKINGQEASPVEYNLTDPEIETATEVLRDVAKREKFFFTEEGNLHHENITRLLIRNAMLENALVLAYQQGGTKQAEIFQTVFPNSDPLSIGTGTAPAAKERSGTPGKMVSRGNVEVAYASQRQKQDGSRYK